jgi:hypothetical protein
MTKYKPKNLYCDVEKEDCSNRVYLCNTVAGTDVRRSNEKGDGHEKDEVSVIESAATDCRRL